MVPLYELGERIAPKAKFAYELSTGSEFLPVPSQDGYASPKEMVYSSLKNKIITPSNKELKENNPSRSAKLRFATRSQNKFNYPIDLVKKFNNYLDLEGINV